MSFVPHQQTFDEIQSIIIKLTNEVADLKKEITTVKDELKQLKSDDSSNRTPEETFSQTSLEKNYQTSEVEDEEPVTDEEDFIVEERITCIEEENENHENTANYNLPNPGTNPQINPPNIHESISVHTQRRLSFFQHQNIQISSGSNVYNTNTLFILAVSVAYQRAQIPTLRTRGIICIMAWSLVFFLFIQVYVLRVLQLDSEHPTCTKHTDCKTGEMCDAFSTFFRQPRCGPCVWLNFYENPCEVDVDLEELLENSWFHSNFTANVDMEAENMSNIFSSEADAMRCVSEQYCQRTTPVGLIGDGCSRIKELTEKASGSAYAVLFFMAILFAVYFYKDMEEAEVENALLDFIISSEPADTFWISMFVIRITNRARRYLLPFYTAFAGAAIILSEDLSAKNITLNLLALIFVIEADDLVAVLVTSANQRQEANSLVENAKMNNVRIRQAEITRDTLFVSMLMCFVCFKIDSLVKYFSCAVSVALGAMILVIGPLAFMSYKFVGNVIFGEKPKKLVRAVLVFLWMWIGYCVMDLMNAFSFLTITPFALEIFPPVPAIAGIISSICVVFRPRKMLTDSYVNSWKNKIINAVMILAWLAVNGWTFKLSLSELGLIEE